MVQIIKPKKIRFDDGEAECRTEEYDAHGGGAFCVIVDCPALYTSNDIEKLIGFLNKAKVWIENKEQYKPKGRKSKGAN